MDRKDELSQMVGSRPTVGDRVILWAYGQLLSQRQMRRYVNATDDPEARFVLLYMWDAGWLFLYPIICSIWLMVWAVLSGVAGVIGHQVGVLGFVFCAGYCIGGSVDAYWRHLLVWRARTRYIANGRQGDDRVRTLMRISQTNDLTTLLQIALGVLGASWLG